MAGKQVCINLVMMLTLIRVVFTQRKLRYENVLFGIQTAYNNFTDTVKVDATSNSSFSRHSLKAGIHDTQAWILAAKLTPNK